MEKYEKPRVLLVDFSPADVQKIRGKGYEALRGATGLHDQGRFSIPAAAHEFDVVAMNCAKDSFSSGSGRLPSSDSVEKKFCFREIMNQCWERFGWSIVFLQSDSPSDLEALGIKGAGVDVESTGGIRPGKETLGGIQASAKFSKFQGKTIRFNDSSPFHEIMLRHGKSAHYRVLTGYGQHARFESWGAPDEPLCTDDAARPNSMALLLVHFRSWPEPHVSGGIAVLPDYGSSNVDVLEYLIREVIPSYNPELYSSPQFSWLQDYLPVPVFAVLRERKAYEEQVQRQLSILSHMEQQAMDRYGWLNDLLIGTGSGLQNAVVKALELLGFEVETVDDKLADGEAKREDLLVRYAPSSYMAICEVKSTKRGADESFISQVQNHQGRYSRRLRCPIPEAILVVNHSFDIRPERRTERFYQNSDVAERLTEQAIVAVDTVALHAMCQRALEEPSSVRECRETIMRGPIIRRAPVSEP